MSQSTWTKALEPEGESHSTPRPASEAAPKRTRKTVGPNATAEEFERARVESFLAAAFNGEVENVRTAGKGTRNITLNNAALKLGSLVAGGALDRSEVIAALTEAALTAGLSLDEIGKTIASGMGAGAKEPRGVPPAKERAQPANDQAPPTDDYVHSDSDAPWSEPAYETSGMDGEAPTPQEEPTAEDPLRGLAHLGKVALVGRDRILELASTPVEYVWTDIAVAGTIVLIAGPPAEGKTTLLFLILAARLNPGEVVTLLSRAIQPAPVGQWVVLIEGEHSEASTGRKLVKSLKLLELDDAALDRVVIVARKAVRLGSPEWMDVVRMVRAGLVSDIAIDTVARVAPADADNEREQVAVFDAVAQAIEAGPEAAPKPIVWAVAHTRKNNTDGNLADVSGSAQRTGQADTVLLIKGEKVDGQTVSTKVTFAKLREDPDDYPMPVTFAIERDAHGVPRMTTTGGKTVADDRPLETRITEQLRSGAKTKTALSSALKRSDKDVDAALSNLFAARALTTTYVKVRGKDCKAFELRPEENFE